MMMTLLTDAMWGSWVAGPFAADDPMAFIIATRTAPRHRTDGRPRWRALSRWRRFQGSRLAVPVVQIGRRALRAPQVARPTATEATRVGPRETLPRLCWRPPRGAAR